MESTLPRIKSLIMHDVLTELRKRFSDVCKSHNLLSESVRVKARVLSSEEAIGNPEADDFPLQKGKERLMQAEFGTGTGIHGSILSKISIGGVAGVFPGLLGIGTGAVLVPAFSFALNAPIKIAIGSSLACFSLNALVSSALKLSQGFVQINILIPLCIGTLIGSLHSF